VKLTSVMPLMFLLITGLQSHTHTKTIYSSVINNDILELGQIIKQIARRQTRGAKHAKEKTKKS
jgi:hypothetical protein